MTGQQYGAAIAKLGLSNRSAANSLQVSERTSRYWIADACRVPNAVKLLLNLMIAKEIKPRPAKCAFRTSSCPVLKGIAFVKSSNPFKTGRVHRRNAKTPRAEYDLRCHCRDLEMDQAESGIGD